MRSANCCRPRRRVVQPAMRGARMGAISARQAITRSTSRQHARLRPRQPASSTSAVRRILPLQVAATFPRALVGSSSTPTRSALASPERSCYAPVRPFVDDSSSRGYSRGTMGTMGVFKYCRIERLLLPHRRSRRRSMRHMVGCARPLCMGSRAAGKACEGRSWYSTVCWGMHRVLPTCTTLSVHGQPQ